MKKVLFLFVVLTLFSKLTLGMQKTESLLVADDERELLTIVHNADNSVILKRCDGIVRQIAPKGRCARVVMHAFSRDNKLLAVWYINGELQVYDVVNGLRLLLCKYKCRVVDCIFSPCGRYLVARTVKEVVQVYVGQACRQQVPELGNRFYIYDLVESKKVGRTKTIRNVLSADIIDSEFLVLVSKGVGRTGIKRQVVALNGVNRGKTLVSIDFSLDKAGGLTLHSLNEQAGEVYVSADGIVTDRVTGEKSGMREVCRAAIDLAKRVSADGVITGRKRSMHEALGMVANDMLRELGDMEPPRKRQKRF